MDGGKVTKNAVAVLFLLLCLRLAWNEWAVLRAGRGVSGSVRGLWRALRRSTWVVGTLVDVIGGVLFAALYILLRRGPPLLGLSPPVIAVLTLVLGSFAPLLYVGLLLLDASSLSVIAPGVAAADEEGEEEDAGPKWLRPKVVGAFFALYLILVIVFCWILMAKGNWIRGYRELFAGPFARAITECYIGTVVFAAVVVVMCEGGNTCSALAWFIAIVVFDLIPTYIYVILAAAKASKQGVSLRKVLLTPPNAASPADDALAAQGGTAMYSAI